MSDDLIYRIAARVGVDRSYRDARGQDTDSPLRAVAAVLQSLGYDVSSDAARTATLKHLEARAASDLAAGTIPVVADQHIRLPVHADGEIRWSITLEDGTIREGRSQTEHQGDQSSISVA